MIVVESKKHVMTEEIRHSNFECLDLFEERFTFEPNYIFKQDREEFTFSLMNGS